MVKIANSEIIDSFLAASEWENFEIKRAEVSPRKLLETTCAMANTEGGYIVVGLEDKLKASGVHRLIGISENEDNISEFLKLVRSDFDPPLQHYVTGFYVDITNREDESDRLYVIVVKKTDDIHSLKSGDTYIRSGSQNVKIGSQEILRRRYEKGSIKFEDENSQVDSFDDLDQELLGDYKKDTGSKEKDAWQFLKDNGLVKTAKNKKTLTNAGVLLFGKNPAVMLGRKCSIRISHYYGSARSYTGEPNFVRRPFTVEGNLKV